MPALLHHIPIFVRDLARSLELFHGLLGWEVTQKLPGVQSRRLARLLGLAEFSADLVFLGSPGQKVFLELIHPLDGTGETGQLASLAGGSLSLAVEELDSLHARLREGGWPPISEPVEMRDPVGRPVRVFCFRTDEGLLVELVAPGTA
ncbi:MAG: VOC family protein [Deltaproteobacteria bacterium]|nr:VOC family protein [Deltaproteobacteria bacterium]